MGRDLYACEICGSPTPYGGTKRCNRCWETERGLDEYLKHPAGRVRVIRILTSMGFFGDTSLPVHSDPFPDGQHQ
jgi:hypothetical protein